MHAANDEHRAPDPPESSGGSAAGAAIVPRRAEVDDFGAEGERLLYNAARDEATTLNRTATEIWQLCDGSRSIDAIAGALGDRYGVDKEALLDEVSRALHVMQERGLVELRSGPAPVMT